MPTKTTDKPWKPGRSGYSSFAIDSADGRRICAVRFNRLDPTDRPIAEQAAALIVRTVNVHDELVVALRGFVDRWSKYPKKPTGRELEIYLENARAVLAKAEGRP